MSVFIVPVLVRLTDGKPRHWREVRDSCVETFTLKRIDENFFDG